MYVQDLASHVICYPVEFWVRRDVHDLISRECTSVTAPRWGGTVHGTYGGFYVDNVWVVATSS